MSNQPNLLDYAIDKLHSGTSAHETSAPRQQSTDTTVAKFQQRLMQIVQQLNNFDGDTPLRQTLFMHRGHYAIAGTAGGTFVSLIVDEQQEGGQA